MKRRSGIMIVVLSFFILAQLVTSRGVGQDQPFGTKADLAFARQLWSGMNGYREWRLQSDYYPGKSPHGKVLKLYSNVVSIDQEPHHVLVKDNYGGKSATVESVAEHPKEFLESITVMVQRDAGYDPDNGDWFWCKFEPGGSVENNPAGTPLAGRVAKGSNKGCIACHANAGGNDYVFSNDE